MNEENNKRDIPYTICENCLSDIKTESDVCRHGDFNLCSAECVEAFKNLFASYAYFGESRREMTEHFTKESK